VVEAALKAKAIQTLSSHPAFVGTQLAEFQGEHLAYALELLTHA
jgi:hypothetical protein